MASKKKTSSEKRELTPFSLRVREAMKLRHIEGEADLVRRIHALAAGDEHEELRRKSLTQQMVNHVLNGHAERSYFTPFLAAALDVSALWLGWGVGPRTLPSAHGAGADEEDSSAPRGRRVAGYKS